MRRFLVPVVASALLLLVAACAGQQNCAGINYARVQVDKDGTIREVEVCGGKEQESIAWTLDYAKDGAIKADFEAEHQEAFKAHEIRAAVEKAKAEVVGDAASDLAAKVIEILVRP